MKQGAEIIILLLLLIVSRDLIIVQKSVQQLFIFLGVTK